MDLFNKKKLDEIIRLYDKTNKLNEDLLKSNNRLIKTSEDLLRISNKLTEENKRLIDWIEKIINEVGVKTNNKYEGCTINIPYCEEIKPYKAYDNGYLSE